MSQAPINIRDVKNDSEFFQVLVRLLADEGLLDRPQSGTFYEYIFICVYDLCRDSVSYNCFLTLIEVLDDEGIDSLFLDDEGGEWEDPVLP